MTRIAEIYRRIAADDRPEVFLALRPEKGSPDGAASGLPTPSDRAWQCSALTCVDSRSSTKGPRR